MTARRLSALRPAALSGGWWAWKALSRVRRTLTREGVKGVDIPAAPMLGAAGERGVEIVLYRRRSSCLEKSLVRQAVLAAKGIHRDVVIGVTGTLGAFEAHAWLDGERVEGRFREMARHPAPVAARPTWRP